jgi:hypothetical protein
MLVLHGPEIKNPHTPNTIIASHAGARVYRAAAGHDLVEISTKRLSHYLIIIRTCAPSGFPVMLCPTLVQPYACHAILS